MFAASAICGATADISMEGKFLEISNEKQLVCPRGPGEIVLLLLQQPFSKYVSISHPSVFPLVCFFFVKSFFVEAFPPSAIDEALIPYFFILFRPVKDFG